MAPKQKKTKRFTEAAKTASRLKASRNPASEKSKGPAIHTTHSDPRATPIKKTDQAAVTNAPVNHTDDKANRPSIKKHDPLSTHSHHAWASSQLPFARDIPSLYNETYLRMIPRGPHHIFSFWEIGGAELEKVKGISEGHAGEPAVQPVLRLYAVKSKSGKKSGPAGAHRIGDIAVPPGIQSHYIRVPESGLTYRIDLGVRTSSGRFITLCQSNEAATPRARVQLKNDGRHLNDREGIATQELIDFSLLSGKMIEEAGRDPESLFMDKDGPLSVEPCHDAAPGQGSTISSWWGTSFPTTPEPLTGKSA
jgi:hypothetical protein